MGRGQERGSTFSSFRELYPKKGLEIVRKEQGPNVGDGSTDLALPSQTRSFFQGIWMGSEKGCRFVERSV